MAKLSIILLFSSFFILYSQLPLAYSKVTNIRFYETDPFIPTPPAAYGDVFAFQTKLHVRPTRSSPILGRAQGTVAYTTPDASNDLHVSVTYIFTSGEYNGSTVVAVGRNDATQLIRQFPIVGGTGAFSSAHGIVSTSTYPTRQYPPIYVYDLEIVQDIIGSEIEMKNV